MLYITLLRDKRSEEIHTVHMYILLLIENKLNFTLIAPDIFSFGLSAASLLIIVDMLYFNKRYRRNRGT